MQIFKIHQQNPQLRLIKPVVSVLKRGGVAVLPTNSGYYLVCRIDEKEAVERIRQLRALDKNHFLTLFCRDFSEVANYAKVDNLAFRFLKAHTPAPLTFVLPAIKTVPKRLLHSKQRSIGIQIAGDPIMSKVLEVFGEALMAVSVEQFEQDWPLHDPYTIAAQYQAHIEVLVDAGPITVDHTTIVDLMAGEPQVLRQGFYTL